jgi:hypothetical protein
MNNNPSVHSGVESVDWSMRQDSVTFFAVNTAPTNT